MSTISAGRVDVSGNLITTNITTANLNATTLTATNINTLTDLSNLHDLMVNGKLQIGDNTTGWGINQNLKNNSVINNKHEDFIKSIIFDSSKNGPIYDTSSCVLDFSGISAAIKVVLDTSGYNKTLTEVGSTINYLKDAAGNKKPLIPMLIMKTITANTENVIEQGIVNTTSSNVPDVNDTLIPIASMTKSVTAMLYARMCTLGVFQGNDTPIPVSKYFPVLNNIKFYVPKYENFIAPTVTSTLPDSSGDIFSYNVKDASGVNPYVVPYECETSFMGLSFHETDVTKKSYAKYPQEMHVAGKYVNLYLTSRKLYLQDSLEESVNFCGGALNWYHGNLGVNILTAKSNLNFGFQAACSDPNSPVYDSNDVRGFADSSGVYHKGDKYIIDNTQTYNDATLDCTIPENELLTQQFLDFSGNSYCQIQEHGRYNYNSSDIYGTATLKAAYNQHYGTNYDYMEIIQREIFTPVCGPVNSFRYYFKSPTDPALAKIAKSWSTETVTGSDNINSGDQHDHGNDAYYLRSQILHAINPVHPLNKPAIRTYFTETDSSGYAAHDASGNKAQMHMASGGILSTVNDFTKFLELILYRGCYMDASGVKQRLIDTIDIVSMITPYEIASDERYNPQVISGNAGSLTFARGCTAIVPSLNARMYSTPMPFLWNSTGFGSNYRQTPLSSIGSQLPGTIYWGGASGTRFFVNPDFGYIRVIAYMISGSNSDIAFLQNKIFEPQLNYVFTPDLINVTK